MKSNIGKKFISLSMKIEDRLDKMKSRPSEDKNLYLRNELSAMVKENLTNSEKIENRHQVL